jgi:hypothetical protein
MVARFSNPNPKFGKILKGLAMEGVVLFYVHLVYFTALCHSLWSFGIFSGHLVYFFHFGMLLQEKSGNPDDNTM